MPLKLRKYDGITGLNSSHPLFGKVDKFIVFDDVIKDLKTNTTYTTTAAIVANDLLGSDVRQFDESGDILSPAISIPFPSTVLLMYRQYGDNSLGGANTRMIHLFAGDMFALEAGNFSSYDYEYTRRGSFGSVFYTRFQPYRTGLDWNTQQAEITARRQQPHCTAIDYVSGASSFWQDGVNYPPTSGDTAPVFTPSTNPVSVQLSQAVGAGKEWNLAGFVVFNTTLSDAEKESITQEPWALTDGTPPVEATISSSLKPNTTITATLINYATLPTTVTVSDNKGNNLSLPLTPTSATTATFTVPDLSSNNTAINYLQFGAVNLTFGSKTIGSDFSPNLPLSYITLIAPVATNAFLSWGAEVPVVGEQLISEGNFDLNGNFTGADPDATYTCWITRLDGKNHKFSIQQGVVDTSYTADLLLTNQVITYKVLEFAPDNPVFNLDVTGIPDGTYTVSLFNHTTGSFVDRTSLTFANGVSVKPSVLPIGTKYSGYITDNTNPPVNGAIVYGEVVNAP